MFSGANLLSKTILIPVLFSLLTLLVGIKVINIQASLWLNEEHEILNTLAEQQAVNLKQQIDSALISLDILSQEVQKNPTITKIEFNKLADRIVSFIKGVTNVQLAPNGVVTYIHPLPGNEQAIGHNLLRDDTRRVDALKSISTRTMVLSGPFKTKQGPVALIARKPIFIISANSESFWGFATAMIHMEQFINQVGLDKLLKRGFIYNIHLNKNSQKPDFGTPTTDDHISITRKIELNPATSWYLTIAYKKDSNANVIKLAYASLLLLCLMIFYVNFRLFNKPKALFNELVSANKELEKLEYTDERSGLPNQHYFDLEFKRSHRLPINDSDIGTIFLIKISKLDSLKTTFSHNSINQFSHDIAKLLRQVTRQSDLVAQIEDDLFVIFIRNFNTLNDVWICANKILKLLTRQVLIEGKPFQQSCKIGISIYNEDGCESETLIKRANIALEAGKKRSANISFFSHEMESNFIEMIELEHQLKQATIEEQFILHFQPQVNINDRSITGFEALVRWKKSESELIYPDKFIGMIENLDLIQAVGYSIIKQATHAQSTFTNIIGRNINMSINLSAKQFDDPELFSVIKENILNVGCPPSCFTFEITESLFIGDADSIVATLNKLRAFGVHVALDDFGTGYSSFEMLRSLPITELKIDKSFVDNLPLSKLDVGITATIITLAKHLNMKVVAEGIETEAQHMFMRDNDCDLGQGYLYSKPLSVDRVIELLYKERAKSIEKLTEFDI